MIPFLKHTRTHCSSINYNHWNIIRLVFSSFPVSTSWLLNLTKVFWNDYVAGCNTASRSATEKNELGGSWSVPCLAKTTQHSSSADGLIFFDVTRLVEPELVRNKNLLSKLRFLYLQAHWYCQFHIKYFTCRLFGGFKLMTT